MTASSYILFRLALILAAGIALMAYLWWRTGFLRELWAVIRS